MKRASEECCVSKICNDQMNIYFQLLSKKMALEKQVQYNQDRKDNISFNSIGEISGCDLDQESEKCSTSEEENG